MVNTNSVDFFRKNTIQPLSENQQLIVAVWEIGNPENAGRIIRLAHNLNADEVLFINQKVLFRESKIKKNAGFSYDQMKWSFIGPDEFMNRLKDKYKLTVLETCEDSQNIFQTRLPDKNIVLAGNESHGLPPEIIKISDYRVHIPIPGNCKSMNVSHALSVAGFEWYRQMAQLF